MEINETKEEVNKENKEDKEETSDMETSDTVSENKEKVNEKAEEAVNEKDKEKLPSGEESEVGEKQESKEAVNEETEKAEIKKHLLYMENLLIDDADIYLENGVHLGLKYRTSDMRPFIFKVRPDKLCVFDIAKVDQRIRTAAKFLARYDPKNVLVVSNRLYGRKPAETFAKTVGFNFVSKRFPSGMLTNPNMEGYSEYELVFITDPSVDQQAIREASQHHTAVLAICDTDTRAKNIDFILPGNNKGKNSLALIFWLLTREILKIRGLEFNIPIPRVEQGEQGQGHEFISDAEPQAYLLRVQELQRIQRRKKRKKKGRSRTKKKTMMYGGR